MPDIDLNHLTLKQKIGQMMLVGFPSAKIDAHLSELLDSYDAGNIILFSRNIENRDSLVLLVDSIQKRMIENTGIPAFLAVDQEGGMVTRLKKECTFLPGNMAFAASGTEMTYRAGQIAGTELRALGINLNLAPVLDVNNNPSNPGIGVRSYSDDPAKVAEYGSAYIKGLQENGVAASAKHFPGKGDCEVDAHIGLPLIAHSVERLESVELLPFCCAIEAGVDAIMVSHVLFPALESERLPATLSSKIQTELLKTKMGFEGIRITDCLEMGAIADHYGTVNAAVQAVMAGADMICVCHTLETQKRCMEAIGENVLSGRIPMARIDEAVTRILRVKSKYGLFEQPLHDKEKTDMMVGCNEHKAFAEMISRKSITLVKDKEGLLPVMQGEKILALSPEAVILTGVEDDGKTTAFCECVKAKLGGDSLIIPVNPDADQVTAAARRTGDYDKVIIGTYNAMFNPGQAALVNEVMKYNQNVIAVSLRVPYDLSKYPRVPVYICAYEYTLLSVESVIHVLEGGHATGRLPVRLAFEDGSGGDGL